MIDTVLHREDVGGRCVRYFSSPLYVRDGREDFPWASLEDVIAVAGLTEAEAVGMIRTTRQEWTAPRTVAAEGRILVIVPFRMADALLDACVDLRGTREAAQGRGGFRRGNTAALKLMLKGRSPMAVLAFALGAMDQTAA